MSQILGIKDIIKERLTDTGQVVGDRFKLAVRSIYGSSDGKTVSHIGSGTLLSYRGHAFVVTASHVVDHAEYSALHILGEKKFVLLNGEVWRTKAPNNKRDDDKLDFAIWPISTATVEQLGPVTFFTEADLSPKLVGTKGHVYLLMGFPNSKQKKINYSAKSVRSNRWHLLATAHQDLHLPLSVGFEGTNHLFLKFDKDYSTDDQWNRVNSIQPRGVSGGPVIDLGKLADVESLGKPARNEGRLVGIVIAYHKPKSATVITKINTIVPELDRCVSELNSLAK